MFRFTIRELVLLTVIVAMGVAWWIDRDRVWKNGERNRQLIDRLTKAGVKLETLLSGLEENPSATSVTINLRPAGTIVSVRVPKTTYRNKLPFAGSSDYQATPRPPLRISDEERPCPSATNSARF